MEDHKHYIGPTTVYRSSANLLTTTLRSTAPAWVRDQLLCLGGERLARDPTVLVSSHGQQQLATTSSNLVGKENHPSAGAVGLYYSWQSQCLWAHTAFKRMAM